MDVNEEGYIMMGSLAGLWVEVWEWLSGNVGSSGMIAIILLLLLLWFQRTNYLKAIEYHDKMVKIKEEEIQRITEDRNEYKTFFFEKHLKSSKDDIYSDLDRPDDKGDKDD